MAAPSIIFTKKELLRKIFFKRISTSYKLRFFLLTLYHSTPKKSIKNLNPFYHRVRIITSTNPSKIVLTICNTAAFRNCCDKTLRLQPLKIQRYCVACSNLIIHINRNWNINFFRSRHKIQTAVLCSSLKITDHDFGFFCKRNSLCADRQNLCIPAKIAL